MARVTTNSLVEGISGMLGNMVFKNMRGKTFVARSPQRPQRQSTQQKENRSKFREATAWAKEILADPERKAYYQKKAKKLQLPNAYTAAITDYMRKPKVMVIKNSDESRTCIVNKKGFALKHAEVITKGMSTLMQAGSVVNGEYTFELSKEEIRNVVCVRIIDEAGNGYEVLVE